MILDDILVIIIDMFDALSIEDVKTLINKLFEEMNEIDEENTVKIIRQLYKKYVR